MAFKNIHKRIVKQDILKEIQKSNLAYIDLQVREKRDGLDYVKRRYPTATYSNCYCQDSDIRIVQRIVNGEFISMFAVKETLINDTDKK